MKRGFQRFQPSAGARRNVDEGRNVVAIAVGGPCRILIDAGDLPGHVISARRLLRADRRPRAELTCHDGSALILQLRPGPTTGAVEKIVAANLHELGRPERLSHCANKADYTIAIQILVECGL